MINVFSDKQQTKDNASIVWIYFSFFCEQNMWKQKEWRRRRLDYDSLTDRVVLLEKKKKKEQKKRALRNKKEKQNARKREKKKYIFASVFRITSPKMQATIKEKEDDDESRREEEKKWFQQKRNMTRKTKKKITMNCLWDLSIKKINIANRWTCEFMTDSEGPS